MKNQKSAMISFNDGFRPVSFLLEVCEEYAEEFGNFMGIRDFFHKVKMGFVRMGETSIPYVSSAKRYGNNGEEIFIEKLEKSLPNCKIKRNVMINTNGGNAEIDSLVLYQNKLFAIEVKRWKGRLTETEQGFIQEKTDRWTGEIHIRYQKSPFKQLNRAIYLLRKQIPVKVWVNGVVFFEDEEFEGISTVSDNVWFDNVKELTDYIKFNGEISNGGNAVKFFEKCVSADLLYANSWDKSLHCVIEDTSLNFQTANGIVTKNDIRYITIEHHWSYDRLTILLVDASNRYIEKENGKIRVNENGRIQEYALCKLDYIEIGR